MPDKTKIDWFPFYIDKYERDTELLDLDEHGLYLKLLLLLYRNDGKIQNFCKKSAKISHVLGVDVRTFNNKFANIAGYFDLKNDTLTHPTVTKHLSKCKELIEKKRKAARARWDADADADAMQVDMQVHDAGAMQVDMTVYSNTDIDPSKDLTPSTKDSTDRDTINSSIPDRSSSKGEQTAPVDNSKPVRKKTKKKSAGNGVDTGPAWWAFEQAYQRRYGVKPVRNAKVNSQMKQFVQRVGQEHAPAIAAYYVNSNHSFYALQKHGVGLMTLDAEKLHTEYHQQQREAEP